MPIREALGQKQIHWEKRRLRSIPTSSGPGGVAEHPFLGASHSKTVTADPSQGAMVLADDTPEWNILLHPAAAGYALVTDATDVAWDQTPTWTGDHTWDDGDRHSPSIYLVGGSNDDTARLYLWDSLTAGRSGPVLILCDDAGYSTFWLENASEHDVLTMDSTGNLWAEGNATIEGHAAIGASGTLLASRIVDINDQMTDVAGFIYGSRIQLDFSPGADFDTTAYAQRFEVAVSTAHTQTSGYICGVLGNVYVSNGIDARDLDLRGGYFYIDAEDAGSGGGAGVADAASVIIAMPVVNTGTITDGYGISIFQGVSGAGTIGTMYGIRISAVTAATTNWAIYSEGGDSWHAGDLKVGGAASVSAQLHVDQSSAAGTQPALLLDQGDVSEQHIVLSIDGTDVDFPAIIELDVTGSPTLWWDESENAWTITDELSLADGDLHLPTGKGIIHADGVTDGQVLVANGTRYIPGNLSDITGGDASFVVMALSATLANERVLTAGSGIALTDAGAGAAATIAVDLVAAWSGLEFSGSDLRIDLDATFNAWTGVHTHAANVVLDDNVGNSPQLQFIGGTNNDVLYIMADNDAVAGASDLRIALADAAGASFFYVRDSAGAFAFGVDSDGNATVGNNLTVPQYVIHDGDTDTYLNFTADQIELTAGAVALLTLTEAATDSVLFGAQADLNGNDLIIDTDGDSYLHASADDVVDLVLATAAGEFGIWMNGAEDFTFTANSFTAAAGSSIYLDDYLYHSGDTDTYVRMQADHITIRAGGVDMIDIVEAGADYVSIGSTTIDSTFTAILYAMGGNIGVSQSGGPGVLHVAAYGADATDDMPIFRGRRARGTRAAPTAAQSGDSLGRVGVGGYGATGFAVESTAYMQMLAAENFTDANMGTHLQLATTPTGSIAPAEVVRVTASARVKIGGSAGADAKLDVDQTSATGAIAAIRMNQADVDQPFMRMEGTSAAGNITRSIVDEGDQSTTTLAGWVLVNVQDAGNQIADGNYWMPLYTLT